MRYYLDSKTVTFDASAEKDLSSLSVLHVTRSLMAQGYAPSNQSSSLSARRRAAQPFTSRHPI